MILRRIAVLLLASLVSACAAGSEPPRDDKQISAAVRAVMEAQQAAWNRGEIDGFMDGYERSEKTTFISGDEATLGWQTVLDRYKRRYTSRDEMGMLTFSELEVTPLSSLYALADGKWQLARANDKPHGRFTLLFHNTANGWRIIHDTTTSAP